VTEMSRDERIAIEQYVSRNLVSKKMSYEGGRKHWIPDKEFYSRDEHGTYARFHINLANDFLRTIMFYGVPKTNIKVFRWKPVVDERSIIQLEKTHLWDPKEHQIKCIDHILDDVNNPHNKIINLQAGGGKTEISKHAMYRTQLRTGCIMKSSYIDRWIPDMEDSFVYKKGELLEISGGSAMNSIMEDALEGSLAAKTLFFSTKTLSLYLESFEQYGTTDMYPIAPIDFFHKLGIGLGVLDEAHQFTHAIMKFFSYLHIHKFVNLSGTLETQDPFKTRMRDLMFPTSQRFTADYYNKYIVVTACMYQLKQMNSIKCTGYGGAYNHAKFEETLQLAKNRDRLKMYVDMIAYYVNIKYVSVRSPGQKMLVFCSTIKFCQVVVKQLQKLWPHLKIGIYVSTEKQKVKDEVLKNADIIVSTVLSCGTAVDIPNLRVSLMTIALNSWESNEQAMLRTRPLRDWPDVDAEFCYFVCQTIDKHVTYHEAKRDYFKNKVKAQCTDMAPFSI
jgi:hypothetical protein